MADDLMDGLGPVADVLANDRPYDVMHLFSRELVENAIRASQHIVHLLASVLLEANVCIAYHDIRVASKLRLLGLQVSKGPAY